MAKKQLIGLVRVSTDQQANEDKGGIPAQEEALERIAERESATLELVYLKGLSGTKVTSSDEWKKIAKKLEKPNVHLAIAAMDRLIRLDEWNFEAFRVIESTNSIIYTKEGETDLTQSGGRLLGGIQALIAGEERRKIRARMDAGKEALRRKGRWVGSPYHLPTGTTFNKQTGKWGYNEEAEKVKQAFELWNTGEHSFSSLSRLLPYSRSAIADWISNPIYKGILRFDKDRTEEEIIEVRVYGEPAQEAQLISDFDWEAAQELRESRKKKDKRYQRRNVEADWSSLLYSYSAINPKDLLVIGKIAEPLKGLAPIKEHIFYSNADKQRYFCRCHQLPEMGKCIHHTYPIDSVDKAMKKLSEVLKSEAVNLRKEIQVNGSSERETIKDKLKSLAQESSQVQSKLDKASDAFIEGVLDKDQYLRIKTKLEDQKSDQDKTASSLRSRLEYLNQKKQLGPVKIEAAWISSNGIELVELQGVVTQTVLIRGPWSFTNLIGYDPNNLYQKAIVEEGYVTAKQLAEYLTVKPGTIRQYVHRKKIPRAHKIRAGFSVWTQEQVQEIKRRREAGEI